MLKTKTIMKHFVTTIIALFILFTSLSNCFADERPDRNSLEKIWQKYLEACASGKISELEKYRSSFALATIKNSLIKCNKQSLNSEFITKMAKDQPDISTLKFVKLIKNGPTVGLVYVNESEKLPRDFLKLTFTIIKFVKEKSEWKVDNICSIGKTVSKDKIKELQFNIDDLPASCKIDGQVKQPPRLIKAPEVAAYIEIYCPSFRTQVTINGKEKVTTTQNIMTWLEKGLLKGKNNIVIDVKQIKENIIKPCVEVKFSCLKNNKIIELFNLQLKENIEGKHECSFIIDE